MESSIKVQSTSEQISFKNRAPTGLCTRWVIKEELNDERVSQMHVVIEEMILGSNHNVLVLYTMYVPLTPVLNENKSDVRSAAVLNR